MKEFLRVLQPRRCDGHRYHHLNRINQSLYVFSALSLLFAYVLLYADPALRR